MKIKAFINFSRYFPQNRMARAATLADRRRRLADRKQRLQTIELTLRQEQQKLLAKAAGLAARLDEVERAGMAALQARVGAEVAGISAEVARIDRELAIIGNRSGMISMRIEKLRLLLSRCEQRDQACQLLEIKPLGARMKPVTIEDKTRGSRFIRPKYRRGYQRK